MAIPAQSSAPGLRIATVRGVPVYLGWTWFLLAAIITVLWGSRLADRTSLGYAVGIVYAVVLLVSVLAHEVAHALVARRMGLPVHRVVADFLGGHTAFDGRELTAGRAAVIAAAGPLANVGVGLAAWGLGLLVTAPLPGMVFSGIAWINFLLAAFNAVPALPLDGGQVLEALVWALTGRRSTGLRTAGVAGRLLAVALVLWLVAWPLSQGRSPDLFTLVWALLLASVIWRGATAAIAAGKARAPIEGLALADVARPVRVAPQGAVVGDLTDDGAAPVVTPDSGGGWLLLVGASDGIPIPAHTPVAAISMRIPDAAVVAATPDTDLIPALVALQQGGIGLALLIEGSRAWGLLSEADVSAALARRT